MSGARFSNSLEWCLSCVRTWLSKLKYILKRPVEVSLQGSLFLIVNCNKGKRKVLQKISPQDFLLFKQSFSRMDLSELC